jgi:hypothetical protein
LTFLSPEKEDRFVWALERRRELIKCRDHPNIVVTDRDGTLMNAADKVFSKSTAIVYRFHVSMNVKSNMKGKCFVKEDSDEYKDIMGAWENILDSETEESRADSFMRFRQVCSQFPIFVEYVESTILGLMKEKVVTASTKRCMHLGNSTTNRVESTHAYLKKYIQNSLGDRYMQNLGMHQSYVGELVN